MRIGIYIICILLTKIILIHLILSLSISIITIDVNNICGYYYITLSYSAAHYEMLLK